MPFHPELGEPSETGEMPDRVEVHVSVSPTDARKRKITLYLDMPDPEQDVRALMGLGAHVLNLAVAQAEGSVVIGGMAYGQHAFAQAGVDYTTEAAITSVSGKEAEKQIKAQEEAEEMARVMGKLGKHNNLN